MKKFYWWLTFSRWKTGSDDAFDAVLNCLDVLDRHKHEPDTMETDSVKRKIVNDLRRVIREMKDAT
jgi:hypothetical protein